ncbi:menaquinone biosynthesis protein [uncultured Desulfosarcina sp.]|uniref:menaquinone biosynthesis protein n=1 Tax=uncultured Desulfosarcina sp. TaxID=218289 RepID=UPI0029C8A9F1|nr:menaquinone biosynthesis protein [uncultured Desulfosarcina sp.]
MSTPIAMIPYANMAPYRQLGEPEGCHFVPLVPSASIDALIAGTVDAAAVPVGGLAKLSGLVETVGQFGIAARGPSMSVLLFSQYPIEQMHAPRTLRLTTESATSVRLLFLLMGTALGFERLPTLVGEGRQPDAHLLIGDRALVENVSAKVWPHKTDLSQQWFELHGLPFVFARWVVRKGAPDAVKESIAAWLDTFKANEAELVARSIPQTAVRLQLDDDVVRRYFQAIRRCLENDDLEGQRLFMEDFQRFGREPLFET